MRIPFSDACERNKDPILNAVTNHFDRAKRVLEIGSGTAQHAVYFAGLNRHLQWQTSDQHEYLEGINAQLNVAKIENVKQPIELNVNQSIWVADGIDYDLIYTANTLHIMSENDVQMFFKGLPKVMQTAALLIVYGPFKYGGEFTSTSNASFDLSLRSRGVGSAIRDFEWVNDLAEAQSLKLLEDHDMPANNQCLVWEKA